MRVAIICTSSLAKVGGVQKVAVDQANSLHKAGIHVEMLAPNADKCYYDTTVPVHSLGGTTPLFKYKGLNLDMAISLKGAYKAAKYCNDFDIIHIHDPYLPIAFFINLFLKKKSKAKIVLTFQTAEENPKSLKPIVFFLKKLWYKSSLKLAVSEFAKNTIGYFFSEEVKILNNGINCNSAVTNLIDRKQLIESKQKNTILFVGRDDPWKGVSVLYDAFDLLLEKVPEAELWIVGPLPKVRYHNQITYYGILCNDELDEIYKRAECFVAPSLGLESFGVVLLEAMNAGAALVASNIKGFNSVATHSKDSILVKPNSPEQLAESILKVLTDDKLKSDLIENGFDTCKQYDNNTIIVNKLTNYYNKILN